jgi:hypothetical protein
MIHFHRRQRVLDFQQRPVELRMGPSVDRNRNEDINTYLLLRVLRVVWFIHGFSLFLVPHLVYLLHDPIRAVFRSQYASFEALKPHVAPGAYVRFSGIK